MDDSFIKLEFLLLGWLLGLFSPIIVDAIRQHREITAVKTALKTELEELRFRLACVVYRVAMHYGNIDRVLLEWFKPILSGYTGTNPAARVLSSVETQLELPEEKLKEYVKHATETEKEGLTIKKYLVPLLDSKFESLSKFDSAFQRNLVEIGAHLHLLNEEVDEARYYFRLTFDSGLSTENRSVVHENLGNAYRNYSTQAKLIANIISRMKW